VWELAVMYVDSEERWKASDPETLAALRQDLVRRIDGVEVEISQRPPKARPDPDTCQFCQVKQMCDEFWSTLQWLPDFDQSEEGGLYDCEFVVQEQVGPRSWKVTCESQPAIFRVRTEGQSFPEKARLRALGVSLTRDDDDGALFFTETAVSEIFLLTARTAPAPHA
jgi:hypothetical protein